MTVPGHAVLFYDSDDALGQAASNYLRRGLTGGGSVVAVVPPVTARVLEAELAADAARVIWRSAGSPGRLMGELRRMVLELPPPVRLLSQFADRGVADRFEAYLRFEAVANQDIAVAADQWVCLCDKRRWANGPATRVRQVHPATLIDNVFVANPEFLGCDFLAAVPEQVAPVGEDIALDRRLGVVTDLADLRGALRRWAWQAGVAQAESLVFAVNEVATNALQHGQPPARVRAWRADAIARVRVDGRGPRVPIDAGYAPPEQPHQQGVGLWLARMVADVVQVESDGVRTAVQLDFPAD